MISNLNPNPGDIILQPISWSEPKSWAIAIHSFSLLKRPRFSHCGIYSSKGQMFTESGEVTLQDWGAAGNLAVPYTWHNWADTQKWLTTLLGTPYDWGAWGYCAIEPICRLLGVQMLENDSYQYTCSSLVGAAIYYDAYMANETNLPRELLIKTVTPDDIAAYLKV